MKLISLVLLLMVASVTAAHPGHGDINGAAHELNHLMWLLGGGALLLSVLLCWGLRQK